MTTTVRALTDEEKARFKEGLGMLKAPWKEGEPLDQYEWSKYRIRKLIDEYPDVALMIGVDE